MDITQVKIFPVQEDKLKAFVSVVFDQCFMVNDIKVIQGKDGLFLSMPSRRKKSGEFKDVAHPLNNEMRRRLEESVLAEYRSLVDDETPRRPDREGEEADVEGGDAPPPKATAPPPGATALPPKPTAPPPIAATTASAPMASNAMASPSRQASPAPVPTAAAESPPAREAALDDEVAQKTLEEVQEIHLRDSFWTVS
ncbi:MAG: septation regulator SpoVG [Acidobacteriota bacterium]